MSEITIQISPKLERLLESYAKLRGMTIQAAIQRAIDELIARRNEPPFFDPEKPL